MREKEVVITTIIGKGAECDGDFSSEGSVRIDGCVNGNVTVTKTLIIGATGCVNGNVSAAVAVIGGEVIGNVNAPEKAELTTTAKVIGDITTGTIIIDEKAVFQGRCDMNQEASSRRPRLNGRTLRAGKKLSKAAIAEALKEVEAESREEAAAEEAQEKTGEQ